jgi:hypothetical protein
MKRRERVIRGQHLAKPGEPARLFEVKVGNQYCPFGGPVEGAVRAGLKFITRERKGNHRIGL